MVIPPTPEPSSTSGCEPEDFVPASPTEPQVALIQRGTCFFAVKVANAEAAGYDAVVVFNEGQLGRDRLLDGVTLGGPVDIPVVGLSFADGAALYAAVQAGPRQGRSPWSCMRFAFWGAEESGLLGSTHYVDSLSDEDLGKPTRT